jgi:hypothetical protein
MSLKVGDQVKAREDIPSRDGGRTISKGTFGVVTEISGPMIILFKVKFDGFATEVFVLESSIEPR